LLDAETTNEIVEPQEVERERVDAEVDDVAAASDRAELRQLNPVVACPERSPGPRAVERVR
jgi:hypothetical protein